MAGTAHISRDLLLETSADATFRLAVEACPNGMIMADPSGQIALANAKIERLFGYHRDELIGQPIEILLPERLRAAHLRRRGDFALYPETRRLGTGRNLLGRRRDGHEFPIEIGLYPIRNGSSLMVLGVIVDIGERKNTDRLKDEFVSTVSHELRTPLTAIRGALGLLDHGSMGHFNDKGANLLRIALANSERLIRLINDILDLERLKSGQERLIFKKVQLSQIVHQAIDFMAPVADAAGVRLMHDDTQAEIAADPDRLLQVLTNLLSNAVKFSPRDSTISVLMRPDVNGVTLSVVDPGRGIPADKLETIFGRFQQVDASDSRQRGGTGLGLAICRTIVHQHSGRIWAERNPVRGTAFRVFLPFKPVPIGTADHIFEEETNDTAGMVAGAGHEIHSQAMQTELVH
jgi:PAS domain S-box-containing protein